MYYSLTVHELDGVEHLLRVVADFNLVQVATAPHHLLNTLPLAQLQYHVDIELILKEPVHFDYAAVGWQVQLNLDFFKKAALAANCRQVLFVDDFSSKLILILLFFEYKYPSKATLTKESSLDKRPS